MPTEMQAPDNLSQAGTDLIGHADLFAGRYVGSVSELKAANHLRRYDWKIFFPGGSRGPADFLAIRDESILAVQCKTAQQTLHKLATKALLELAKPIGATPLFTCRDYEGKTLWHAYFIEKWVRINPPRWKKLTVKELLPDSYILADYKSSKLYWRKMENQWFEYLNTQGWRNS